MPFAVEFAQFQCPSLPLAHSKSEDINPQTTSSLLVSPLVRYGWLQKKKKKKEIQYSVHRNVEMVVPGWGAGLAGVGRKPLLSPTIRLVETTDVTESSQRLRSLRLLREQEIIWEILRDVLDERWRIEIGRAHV